jgi:hypothetical protein
MTGARREVNNPTDSGEKHNLLRAKNLKGAAQPQVTSQEEGGVQKVQLVSKPKRSERRGKV